MSMFRKARPRRGKKTVRSRADASDSRESAALPQDLAEETENSTEKNATDSTEPFLAPPDSAEELADNGESPADPNTATPLEETPLFSAPSDEEQQEKASDTPAEETGFDREQSLEDKPMTLTDHLTELRTRIVRMLIGAAVGFFLCYGVAEELFRYLSLPLVRVMPPDTRLIYTSVPEGFFVYLKIALMAGIFLASPYIFYQLWAFIAPGLYKEERRMVLPLALFSALFFLLGAAFCYLVVFPFAFSFFMSYSTGPIVAMPSLNEYLGFSLKMILAFGLIFEMPLFAFFLSRLGLITPEWMRNMRRYAILVVFIVAAILTPPDVFSQLLMAVPMLILYELSILVAALARKKASGEQDAEPVQSSEHPEEEHAEDAEEGTPEKSEEQETDTPAEGSSPQEQGAAQEQR